MRAVLTSPYACAPEGHTVLRWPAGTMLEGRAAELALSDGAAIEASEAPDLETKIEPPDETKAAPKKRARKG